MASLLVKDVPPQLLWSISTAASLSGQTNREWVMKVLERETIIAIAEKKEKRSE